MGSTRRYRLDRTLQSSAKDTRPQFSANVSTVQNPAVLIIGDQSIRQDFPRIKDIEFGKRQDVWDVKNIPKHFISTSKHSTAIEKLLGKRKTEHEAAIRSMKEELTGSYATCEQEFRNRSITLKIQINGLRKEINDVRDKLQKLEITDLNSVDYDTAWVKVKALIDDEKQLIDHFYESLRDIEKKRQELTKPILQKYYKIMHKISYYLPYEIQVYLEKEIVNYNVTILGNLRIYADLKLQLHLLAATNKIQFNDWLEEMKRGNREAIRFNNDHGSFINNMRYFQDFFRTDGLYHLQSPSIHKYGSSQCKK